MKQYHIGEENQKFSQKLLRLLAYGTISAKHAGMFIAFSKNADNKFLLDDTIKGEKIFPGQT